MATIPRSVIDGILRREAGADLHAFIPRPRGDIGDRSKAVIGFGTRAQRGDRGGISMEEGVRRADRVIRSIYRHYPSLASFSEGQQVALASWIYRAGASQERINGLIRRAQDVVQSDDGNREQRQQALFAYMNRYGNGSRTGVNSGHWTREEIAVFTGQMRPNQFAVRGGDPEVVAGVVTRALGERLLDPVAPVPSLVAEGESRLRVRPTRDQARALNDILLTMAGGEEGARTLLEKRPSWQFDRTTWSRDSQRLFDRLMTPERAKSFQEMLLTAGPGIDLGRGGPKGDGVDGQIGRLTLTALTSVFGTEAQPGIAQAGILAWARPTTPPPTTAVAGLRLLGLPQPLVRGESVSAPQPAARVTLTP
jgi:hypothetical protein